jgi:deazaflavin-dependent oxidoreductase (nitroreductase family)
MGLHVGLYRLTSGRIGGRIFGMDAMLLTTRGRRSGKVRTTPITYFPQSDGSMILIASNGGAPTNPAWYHNLKGTPEATIQLRDRTLTVRADEIPAEQAAELWPRLIAIVPLYDGYRQKTTRTIPLLRLTPVS